MFPFVIILFATLEQSDPNQINSLYKFKTWNVQWLSIEDCGFRGPLRVLQMGCLGLGPHLFVKVPRPGDSEVTFPVFESSCHLLLPV